MSENEGYPVGLFVVHRMAFMKQAVRADHGKVGSAIGSYGILTAAQGIISLLVTQDDEDVFPFHTCSSSIYPCDPCSDSRVRAFLARQAC